MSQNTDVIGSVKDGILKLLGVMPPDGSMPLTEEDMEDVYKDAPSFTQFLPWKDYNSDLGVFEFEDGVSVGAVFELKPIDVEGRSTEILKKIESGIQKSLQNIPTYTDSPWIIQFYLQDEPINGLIEQMENYATPDAKKTEHFQFWLDEYEQHIKHMSKDGGLFYDNSSRFWWSGQNRKVRCVFYRRSDKKEWFKRGRPIAGKGTPASELNEVVNGFVGSLIQTGIDVKRYDASDLLNWLVPWFSPNPEGFENVYEYLKNRKFDSFVNNDTDEVMGVGADLAEMSTLGCPKSNANGSWNFTGEFQRLISMQAIDTPPITGVLTAEQESAAGKTASMWDQLPKGCIWVTTLVMRPQARIKSHCNSIIESAGKGSAEARQAADQAADVLENIASGSNVYPAFCGLYVRGADASVLAQNTQRAMNVLSSFQFNPMLPQYDPTAMDNFLRHLPMAYSFEHDDKNAKITRLTYANHVARLSPLYGRGTGTGNVGKLFFNRIGEPFSFDPVKDRSRVAHSLIFGPTGAGKSALINYMVMHDMAMCKPRTFIIEKGGSFDLLGLYFKNKGLSVNSVKFTPSTDISLPPYAKAFEALEQAEANDEAMELALNTTVDTEFEDLEDPLSTGDNAEDDEMRDYLGEMELITRMMMTGADAKKESEFELPDKLLVRRAILEATRIQRDKKIDYVLPSHVVDVIRNFAKDGDLSDNRRERIESLADALDYWTDGLHGKFFNRPGKAWPECDLTILDMGILTSDQYKDMLAVAIISMINTITGIGEKYQYEGRQTQVYTDEGHAITTNPTLVKPFVFGAKTWRKLSIWLNQATQNLSDYPAEASKMLSLAEWWYCLNMTHDEVDQIGKFKRLTDEQKDLLVSARKEKGLYTEGVILSDKLKSLFRVVMPALPLALAGTDDDEKKARREFMREHDCTEIEAIYHVANSIKEKREL